MKKMAVMLILGLISGGVGIYFLYIFFTSLKTGGNFIFLISSLVFLSVSIILIIKLTNPKKSDNLNIDQTKVYEKTLETLVKNNATFAEWEKTNEEKDKLELLKMESQAQEDAEKELKQS
jgi:hypothetical protein